MPMNQLGIRRIKNHQLYPKEFPVGQENQVCAHHETWLVGTVLRPLSILHFAL